MFKSREEAGLLLAEMLKEKKIGKDTIVIAIPRGGVIVGKILAEKLNLRLFAIVIKKIGAPNNPELAIGAVGTGGVVFWDKETIRELGIDSSTLKNLKKTKEKEAKDAELYLKIKLPDFSGKSVILVDDGVATGSTVKTAARILRNNLVRQVILAAPVISQETYENLRSMFLDIIFLLKPVYFRAVGEFYKDFPQVENEEVKEILESNYKLNNE